MEMRSGFGCDQSALVRQPRFSKTFHMLGTIFRSPKWRHDVVKIGQAKLRVELAQPCHQLVRFGDVARQCIWTMQPPTNTPQPFASGLQGGPVDLKAGQNGDLFYADFVTSTVRRIRHR